MLRKDPFITGEYYHIYNRGIDKRVIFKSVKDYERFVMLLGVSNSQYVFRLDNLINKQNKNFEKVLLFDKGKPIISISAWCLMPNHFHLLVKQEIDGGITKFMRKLGVGYSMFFNIKYQRQGALFGGPFKSKCIKEDDNYMRQLFAYIHLNPLELQFPNWEKEINKYSKEMKEFLETYRYSSYQDYIGKERVENNIINPKKFPDYFEKENSFRDFVEGYFIEI